jgi:Transposase IS116/IS110/IS902 family
LSDPERACLSEHQDAVQRLAEVPGLGVDSAQQIIAEVGPAAATFPSEKCLSSWVGACPGDQESAGVNYSHRSPKGNRHMRRLLNQAANSAAKTKGSIFEIVYRRSVPRLGHNQTIWAIAETAEDGIKGVFEANTGTELGEEDCVALAAGMVGELVCLGHYDSKRVLHDRQQIQRIIGKALEDFAPEAREIIKQNLHFFSMLNIKVQNRITALLLDVGVVDWERLPLTIPIITLAELEQVYQRAESEKSRSTAFHGKTW